MALLVEMNVVRRWLLACAGAGLLALAGCATTDPAVVRTQTQGKSIVVDSQVSQPHGAKPSPVALNLLPKYGEQPLSKEVRELNDKFIAAMDERFAGDRGKASAALASLGWQYFSEGDLDVAMRRFNQAWLLSPGNGSALWGMGAVLSNRQDHRAALRLFSEAEASLGTTLPFQIDHARALGFAGTALEDPVVIDDALARFASIHRQNPPNAINLQNWAMALYVLKKYDEAWQKIELAKATPDAKLLSPAFIEDVRVKAERSGLGNAWSEAKPNAWSQVKPLSPAVNEDAGAKDGGVQAQSQLPPCLRGSADWWRETACSGTYASININGTEYAGEMKDGKSHGQGDFTFPNGNKYVGEIKDYKANGQGTFTMTNGEKYVGEFKDGKFNGQGTYTFPNGNKYVGEFKDDQRHGQGTVTLADGSVVRSGIWKNGDFVR